MSIHSPNTLTERKVWSLYVAGVGAAVSPEITWGWEGNSENLGLLSTSRTFSLVFWHLACPRDLILIQSTHLYLLFFSMANIPLPLPHPFKAGSGLREFRTPLGAILSHGCHPTELSAAPRHAQMSGNWAHFSYVEAGDLKGIIL